MTEIIPSLDGEAFFIIDYDRKTPSGYIARKTDSEFPRGWKGHVLRGEHQVAREGEYQVILVRFSLGKLVIVG